MGTRAAKKDVLDVISDVVFFCFAVATISPSRVKGSAHCHTSAVVHWGTSLSCPTQFSCDLTALCICQ